MGNTQTLSDTAYFRSLGKLAKSSAPDELTKILHHALLEAMKRSIGDDVVTYRDGVPVALNIPGLLWMKVLNFAFAKRISALCHVVRGQHHI